MSARSPTSFEVPQRARVSRTTASLVLNRAPGASISEGTRASVLKAARDMGYIPHAIGKALASRRTRSIGVAFSTEQASHPFLQLVIEGLSQATRNRDQRLLVESFDERDRAAKVLQLTRARQIDIDNREAARTAVDHLLDLGHRRIACITNAPTSCLSSADRLAGWREALHGRGAKPEATPSPSGP